MFAVALAPARLLASFTAASLAISAALLPRIRRQPQTAQCSGSNSGVLDVRAMLVPVVVMTSALCTSDAVALAASHVGPPVHVMPTAAAVRHVNQAAECVNGYRTTHVVRGHGRTTQGVILRCRN